MKQPAHARSVAWPRRTSNASGESRSRHSASVRTIFSRIARLRPGILAPGPAPRLGAEGSAPATRGEHLAEHLRRGGEHLDGGVPRDAGVGDRLAVAELREVLGDRLRARLEEALDHEPDDRAVPLADLVDHVAHHERLVLGLL